MSELDGLRRGLGQHAPPLDIERARAEGLIDISFDEVDSPWGPWTAFVTERGLVRLAYVGEDAFEEMSDRISPRMVRDHRALGGVRRQVDEYFERTRTDFDLPIDWQLVTGFSRKVLRACARIPYGATASYGDLAKQAGSPRAARAAGNALHNNPVPIVVPCHRVLHADGGLGGYGGGLGRKVELLELEGALP